MEGDQADVGSVGAFDADAGFVEGEGVVVD
jgi:hypothetical protein